jgi:hypothetical protein
VALSPELPLFHVLPCFPTLKLSSLHPLIFGHPYFTYMKFDFQCYEFSMSFPSHLLFGFPLEENFLPSNFEEILWSNKFLKGPHVEFYFFENQDGLSFL